MNIKSSIQVDTKIYLEVNMQEASALFDLAGYGYDAFIAVFYEKLGESYMRQHADGLKTLFESIKKELPIYIATAEKIEEMIKIYPNI